MLTWIAVSGPTASGKSTLVRCLHEKIEGRGLGFTVHSVSLSGLAFKKYCEDGCPYSFEDASRAILRFVEEGGVDEVFKVFKTSGYEFLILERWFTDWIAFLLVEGAQMTYSQSLRPYRHLRSIVHELLLSTTVPSGGLNIVLRPVFKGAPPDHWNRVRKTACNLQSALPGAWDLAASIVDAALGDVCPVFRASKPIDTYDDAEEIADLIIKQFL